MRQMYYHLKLRIAFNKFKKGLLSSSSVRVYPIIPKLWKRPKFVVIATLRFCCLSLLLLLLLIYDSLNTTNAQVILKTDKLISNRKSSRITSGYSIMSPCNIQVMTDFFLFSIFSRHTLNLNHNCYFEKLLEFTRRLKLRYFALVGHSLWK